MTPCHTLIIVKLVDMITGAIEKKLYRIILNLTMKAVIILRLRSYNEKDYQASIFVGGGS